MLRRFIQTTPDKGIIIIRFLVGWVFVSEGIQKFLFSETLGAGRFEKIGLPVPEFLGYFVGTVEICCGLLLVVGLLVRFAALQFVIIMFVAIVTTKSDIYLAKGFWELLHTSRTDWSMLLGSMFILIKGAGFYSIDHAIVKK